MGGTTGSSSFSLDDLFRPRSVAIIGASRRQGAIGRQVVANMLGSGFAGPVYPVNPKAQAAHSVPALKSVASIPGPVDLAALVVPADAVLRVAEQCGAKGVKGLVVVTAGFGEIGGKGIARETKLGAIAESYGMRVIGPNCMGVINTEPDVRLNATFAATLPEAGPVASVLGREMDSRGVEDLQAFGHVRAAVQLYTKRIPPGDECMRRDPAAQWVIQEERGHNYFMLLTFRPPSYTDRVGVRGHDKTFALRERTQR